MSSGDGRLLPRGEELISGSGGSGSGTGRLSGLLMDGPASDSDETTIDVGLDCDG